MLSLALSEHEREGKLGENILDHHAVQGKFFKAVRDGTSLVIQWLRLHTSKARGMDSIPGQGAKIPHASGSEDQNMKQKQYCNKFNKDFKKIFSTLKKNYIKKNADGAALKKKKRKKAVRKSLSQSWLSVSPGSPGNVST